MAKQIKTVSLYGKQTVSPGDPLMQHSEDCPVHDRRGFLTRIPPLLLLILNNNDTPNGTVEIRWR